MKKNSQSAQLGRGVRSRILYLAALTAVWGLPSVAFAAGGAGHASIASLFWPAVNFTLYAILLSYGYRKVARPLLRDRSVQLKQDITSAAKALDEAEREIAALQQRLELIDEEKSALRNRLQGDGDNIAASLITDAERAAKRKREDTERRILSEFARVRAEIQREVVYSATATARQRLSSELSREDDQRLRQEAVRSLIQN